MINLVSICLYSRFDSILLIFLKKEALAIPAMGTVRYFRAGTSQRLLQQKLPQQSCERLRRLDIRKMRGRQRSQFGTSDLLLQPAAIGNGGHRVGLTGNDQGGQRD